MKIRIGISIFFFVLINVISYIYKNGFLSAEGLDSVSFKIVFCVVFILWGLCLKISKKYEKR